MTAALEAEIALQSEQIFANFNRGLAMYLQAQVPDWQPDASIIAEIGGSRLLDYGGQGEAILLVPPLINKANILDLNGEMSFANKLRQNARVFLLDWGVPSEAESGFAIANYVERLQQFAALIAAPQLHIVGYCMGGLLALKAAQAVEFASIVLVATPFEFDHLRPQAKVLARFLPRFAQGFVAPEIVQSLFFALDPWRVHNKFAALPTKTRQQQERFFCIEKWANDGVALPFLALVEVVEEWVLRGNLGVDFSKISVPIFAACPRCDKIVPLAASMAVLRHFPRARAQQFESGHIGLVTKDLLLQDMLSWLKLSS